MRERPWITFGNDYLLWSPAHQRCSQLRINVIDFGTLPFALFALLQSQPVQRVAAVERQPLWLEFVAYMYVPSRWPALQPLRRLRESCRGVRH